jgi:uncharacterized protein YjbJ (UPF0337 family)
MVQDEEQGQGHAAQREGEVEVEAETEIEGDGAQDAGEVQETLDNAVDSRNRRSQDQPHRYIIH